LNIINAGELKLYCLTKKEWRIKCKVIRMSKGAIISSARFGSFKVQIIFIKINKTDAYSIIISRKNAN
jgi:hypothetical protein